MNNREDRTISARSTYIITFLLGFSFSITLVQSTWNTAIERKQKDFHFEILSIQQSVASNVLTANDATNNVAALISSSENLLSTHFESFTEDILYRYDYIEAINFYYNFIFRHGLFHLI